MSVVVGKINLNNEPVSKQTFRKVVNKINFFQADKIGITIKNEVGLGSLLLFHTPESQIERQPYTHPNYPVTIVADVRLDNRDELIRNLCCSDTKTSDTELILHTYIKYQENCLQHLIGAFTFIIWDERSKFFFCARDQMGVRPFHYYFKNKTFVACSIAKGITSFPDTDLSINDRFIKNTFLVSKLGTEETFHKYIKVLLPAHYLTLQDGNIKIHKYWELDTTKQIYFKNPEDYILGFQEKIFEAVKCRLRGTKNIGLELSGGLDSSGIAVIASQLLKENKTKLHAFTYAMKPEHKGKYYPYDDESVFFEAVCKKAGIINKTKIINSNLNDIHQENDLSLWLYEGINFVDSLYLDTLRQNAQASNVNILLSGFLGDALVTSFAEEYYLEYLEEGKVRSYVKTFLTNKRKIPELIQFGILWSISKWNTKLANSIYRQTQLIGKKIPYKKLEKYFLSPSFVKQHPHLNLKNHVQKKLINLNFSLREVQKKQIEHKAIHQRMASENTTGLYRRMQTRYPLGDIRLLQYVLSLPAHQKRNNQHNRLIFRRSLANLLPDNITWRSVKTGSVMPFEDYEYIKKWHDKVVIWLETLKKDNRFDFINIDKIIKKEMLRKNIDNLPKNALMLRGKVRRIQMIMRYIELNGTISSSIFEKSFS